VARKSQIVDSAVVCLAMAVRVAAVLILQSHDVPRSTYEHGEIAANILAGRGFSIHFLGADGPTSQQAPVYPAIVALAYAVGGVETPQALLLLELGQSALGGLLVLGVIRLVRLIAPGRPWFDWTAGFIVAIHPTLIYAATHVQVAGLAATLLMWTLVLAYQTGTSGRIRDAVFTGWLMALLALTDPILTLVGPGVVWSVWLGQSGWPRCWSRVFRLMTVTAILAGLGIAPWLVRNFQIHGEFVAIKSTFGYAFWQGNCAVSEGTDKVVRSSVEIILDRGHNARDLKSLNRALWEARHEAGYIDDIALSKDDIHELGSVSEPQRSRILFNRAIAELQHTPGRYARLCLRRLRYFLLFDETNPKSRVLVYRLAHLGLLSLAAVGLLIAGPSLRKRLLPTIVTVAAIALFHSLTIVSARFHVPIEPILAIWGAAGLNFMGKTRGSAASSGIRHPALSRAGRRLPAARHDVEGVRIIDGGFVDLERSGF
jgi:hypothetical protein